MLKSMRKNGFTLIELIVVVSLISLILFFTLPRFHSDFFSDNTKKVSRWIMLKARTLKEKAVREKKIYILHVSLDANRLWTSHEAMSPDELQIAEEKGYEVSDDIDILDVEYPDDEKISTGQAHINFYEKGYSDQAIIHMKNSDDEHFSFLIEPFLSQVRMYNTYVDFED
jgi:prepilin-type N-terminal cleavage/methylation domain-containing protein